MIGEGVGAFELGIVAEVFGLARPEFGADWYRFVLCAEHPGRVVTNAGVTIQVDAGLDALASASTIVLPGWRSDGTAPSRPVREHILAAHARGARLVSVCSGAFLLAAVGLLDGRPATTHWRYADRLQALHPTVAVDAGTLFTEDGQIFTSAGSAAGIDLLLHLVRKDRGAAIANGVARRMVVAAHRSGGQAQFIERPVPANEGSRLADLLDRIRAAPADPWTVERMAKAAAMSGRTLARRFREATGMTPAGWLAAQRVSVARDLLETTALPIERIAEASGLGSAANLRLHFNAQVGVAPAVYRRQFRRDPTA
jgi:AraC family transcriptional activator FtrA